MITTVGWDEARAVAAGRALEGSTASQVLEWALAEFPGQAVLAASMADAVVVHLASSLRREVPVIFLDTGYHFAETLGMADAVEAVYPVRLERVLPLLTVGQQDAANGSRLHERDPDACCAMRKVEPMDRALAHYSAWISGIRRQESAARSGAGLVEWDARRAMVKVNPIAAWSDHDVAGYIAEHGVLVNPLRTDGYESVGCAPCTRRTRDGEHARAGRWAGLDKVECGLHL